MKPQLGIFWTPEHTPWAPAAFLRLVCLMDTKGNLIDLQLSNILHSPHHVVISKNEQWIKQNAISEAVKTLALESAVDRAMLQLWKELDMQGFHTYTLEP